MEIDRLVLVSSGFSLSSGFLLLIIFRLLVGYNDPSSTLPSPYWIIQNRYVWINSPWPSSIYMPSNNLGDGSRSSVGFVYFLSSYYCLSPLCLLWVEKLHFVIIVCAFIWIYARYVFSWASCSWPSGCLRLLVYTLSKAGRHVAYWQGIILRSTNIYIYIYCFSAFSLFCQQFWNQLRIPRLHVRADRWHFCTGQFRCMRNVHICHCAYTGFQSCSSCDDWWVNAF